MEPTEPLETFPAAYEPEWLGTVASLRSVAIECATNGAPEGSLLIADHQTAATGSNGKTWFDYPANLNASIVLEPEVGEDRYHELAIVGLVALGQAIAAEVSPMTALNYTWPNDINVASSKIASIWVDHGNRSSDGSRWLAITGSVNVAQGPDDFSIPAMSLHEAEGSSAINAQMILTGWARQFIGHLNDWDADGFEPLYKFWRARLELEARPIDLMVDGKSQTAKILSVDQNGSALLRQSNSDTTREVSFLSQIA